ncbi:peptidoglycan-binding protein [Pedobacter frigidisoli]|uniref:peptidoglycan-binding protein n=1 Tax=Pedobacter frigidisoli TaxID=2530455 RepID=UPI00292D8436|nr:peptidoglycan-binding protein [Pedobacter frigidisoli]
MATIKFLFCILCTACICSSGLLSGGILGSGKIGRNFPSSNYLIPTIVNKSDSVAARLRIISIAQAQLGVRETTGNNDGVAVENYLRYTGNVKGDPWCAAFVSWVYGRAGLKLPHTAWSPSLFPTNRRVNTPQPADVFGIYFPGLKRIAHCGIVKTKRGSWIVTIEGNTNITGSREGDGVYSKYRHKRTIRYYADWLKGGGT